MDIVKALEFGWPGASWSMNGDEYEGLVWHDKKVPQPSEEEVAAAWGDYIGSIIPARINVYRDERALKNIGFGDLFVYNDDLTRQRLLQKINTLQLQNDPEATVNWKTINGFSALTLTDLQGLYLACDQWQQRCFDVAKEVLALHESTPYKSFEAAQEVFDDLIKIK